MSRLPTENAFHGRTGGHYAAVVASRRFQPKSSAMLMASTASNVTAVAGSCTKVVKMNVNRTMDVLVMAVTRMMGLAPVWSRTRMWAALARANTTRAMALPIDAIE